MTQESLDFILKIFLFYLPLLFSLCVHEFAHAWTAKKKGDLTAFYEGKGDLTAFYEGRLTLNPIVHVDYLGTLILPLIFLFTNSPLFFGWAKPVPVNPHAFKKPKQDMFWVAFAGPLSNIFLAIIGTLILSFLYLSQITNTISLNKNFISMMEMFIYLNMLLAFFNLIPLHPLDGGKVIARFLPIKWNLFLEENQKYSYILLILFLISGAFYYLSKPILFTSQYLIGIAQSLSQ
ncbi:MAG: site-2 protease family protein, partial [Bdellovibrionaceae bacterium]|nr:site-2 protease family protein [Pseudobdellovibrionaceae bacterium]